MARLSLTASELSELMKSLSAAYHLEGPPAERLPRGTIHLDALEPTAVIDRDIPLLAARMHCISGAVVYTLFHNQSEVKKACTLIASWMKGHKPVRILGAGRALLAGAMPGNRLAHAGAQVSFMGGMVPLPNSSLGGGIIACSASGKTKPVLEAMAIAGEKNSRIKTIGIADSQAVEFRALCDVFIGLCRPKEVFPNPLSALADTEEYMIAEILDGLVVLAGKSIGFSDKAWRKGHEDIGPTGPYAPRGKAANKRRTPRTR
jgi:D-arabinose 5-phosphate isomerase GutQ